MNIISIIVQLLLTLSVFVVPICILLGVAIGLSSSKINDQVARNKRKKLAWNVALYPLVTVILVLVIWGLLSILTGTK